MMAHLIACTVTAAIALGAAMALRGRSAGLRHALILAAILRFALPTDWLAEAGRKLAPRQPIRAVALTRIGHFAAMVDSSFQRAPEPRPRGRHFDWLRLFWCAGFAATVSLWMRGMLRRIPEMRAASVEENAALERVTQAFGGRAALSIVARDQAPGACGIWRPKIVLPDGLSKALSADELEAVLAHELAHIRRRDNLTAAAAHLVSCAFWFYPLVWWLERQAHGEREAACDELVLRRGVNPEDYLAAILKVCRMAFSVAPAYAAATGANLKRRMAVILAGRFRRPAPSALRMAVVTVVAAGVVAPLGTALVKDPPIVSVIQRIAAIPMSDAAPAPQPTLPQQAKPRVTGKLHAMVQAPPPVLQTDQPFRGHIQSPMPQVSQLLREPQAAEDETVKRYVERVRRAFTARSPADKAVAAGVAQLEAGNALGAEESFRMALALEPWNGEAVEGIVSALIAQGRRNLALTFLNQHKPAFWNEDPAAALTFAQALDQAGDWRSAEKAYSMTIALDPKNVTALNNVAALLLQHGGDLDDALMYAKRAFEQGADLPDVIETLGLIQLRRGEFDAASQMLNRLLQAAPERAAKLAIEIALSGRSGEVREMLTVALAASASPEAKQAIGAILSQIK